MTSQENDSRINVEAFQAWFADGRLEVMPGIAVVDASISGLRYLDPQHELDYPAGSFSFEPGGRAEIIINEESPPPVVSDRLYLGSMAVQKTKLGYELYLGQEGKSVSAPDPEPIGRAALVGIVERPNFSVTKLLAGQQETRRLQSFPPTWRDDHHVNLFLLSEGGKIRVVCGPHEMLQRYELLYDSALSDVVVRERRGNDTHGTDYEEGKDESGPDSGGGPGGDREPRHPTPPAGSAAAEVEEPQGEEQRPLVLRGRAA